MNETMIVPMVALMSFAEAVCYGLDSFTIEEVSEKLSVDERTVREWISRGELRAVNVSRAASSLKPRLRIMEDDVMAFLVARSLAPQLPVKRSRKIKPTQWV